MNGWANPPPPGGPQPPAWKEHFTPNGRAYYYNSVTKATQWSKPEDLMSHAEVCSFHWVALHPSFDSDFCFSPSSQRALINQPWKEYTAEGGRKYWYNIETKQSSWEMPEAFKNAMGPGSFAPTAPHGPAYGSGRPGYRDPGRGSFADPRQLARSFVPATESSPEYASHEEAVAAFTKTLRRHGVQSDWTWEQAIRAAVKDPGFRAIKKPKVRRETFEKYCQDMVLQEKERAQERLAKLRADFETMLKRHPDIKHYTAWKTARPMLEGETHFRSTDDENERRQLFDEYIARLKKEHEEQQIAQRKAALEGLRELLPKLAFNVTTFWPEARKSIAAATQNDPKYRALTKCDVILKFQDYLKYLERILNEKTQFEKKMRFRQGRKNREAFKSLLAELRRDGHIKAGSKWTQIYHLVADDERYRKMLGQVGSTPIVLFWDLLGQEDLALRRDRNTVMDALDDQKFNFTLETTIDEYLSAMNNDRRTANIAEPRLRLIFARLREKRAVKRDEERHFDRHQRRALDDLRSSMRHLDPPIKLGDTWEAVRARVSKSAEFQAVASEEAARHAFERHMYRLRERAEEENERNHRRNSRVSSDRDVPRRGRDRSRDERPHRRGRSARRSRSPEPDPYEDDRRRAVAERERNHRRSAMAENVLSAGDRARLSPPPRRERDYRERDRGYDHYSRHRRSDDGGAFARERREREDDRERPFRRHVDTRSVDELNYGDDGPSTAAASRRRRHEDDDAADRREQREPKARIPPYLLGTLKRLRKGSPQERTQPRETRQRHQSPLPARQTVDMRSGSEEGEIEE
ncbi:hypothetical protein L249_3586 [Ophiocordyceps polyrhachis-furcata BCC 54312]|uniref:Pre-mRNA-processing protein prp40 n=1 Tax=Ophiocordyceps polyrhachis-furcata BCC 54312 TaxID=1330021 RepID=A0A367LML1_9HYPO|nr:hypothetical protein L249_3586 [Ophiocordyceps polyrhachis-furcata BCC 54312]